MAERYEILQYIRNPFIVEQCPVILLSHALTKDTETDAVLLQCKFENLDKKEIIGFYISVFCSDIIGNKLDGVKNFSYLDLNVSKYQIFGRKVPVYLPHKNSRVFSIIPEKIIYKDGTVWEKNADICFHPLKEQVQLIESLGELSEQYRRDLNKICIMPNKHMSLPTVNSGYIICGCGEIVCESETVCPACGVSFDKLFALNNESLLKANLEQYLEAKEEEQRQLRQNEILTKRKRKIKIKKITILFVCLCIILAITGGVYSILSHHQYEQELERTQIASRNIDTNSQSIAARFFDSTVAVAGTAALDRKEIESWEDIIAVSALNNKIIGYKADGSIVIASLFRVEDFLTENLKNTILVTEGIMNLHEVILKSDGTVVATGNNTDGQCNVEEWTDIIDISAGCDHTVGLRSDGTVVATGNNEFGQCNVEEWTDIIDISAGFFYTVGLKSDGTVVATGNNTDGRCNVEKWRNIVYVSAKGINTLGLKSDGTIVLTGAYEQNELNEWTDIIAVAVDGSYTVGLKSDGTVVNSGYKDTDEYDISDWCLF